MISSSYTQSLRLPTLGLTCCTYQTLWQITEITQYKQAALDTASAIAASFEEGSSHQDVSLCGLERQTCLTDWSGGVILKLVAKAALGCVSCAHGCDDNALDQSELRIVQVLPDICIIEDQETLTTGCCCSVERCST